MWCFFIAHIGDLYGLRWNKYLATSNHFSCGALIFGSGKLKTLGSDLGSGLKSFKKAVKEEDKEDNKQD